MRARHIKGRRETPDSRRGSVFEQPPCGQRSGKHLPHSYFRRADPCTSKGPKTVSLSSIPRRCLMRSYLKQELLAMILETARGRRFKKKEVRFLLSSDKEIEGERRVGLIPERIGQ